MAFGAYRLFGPRQAALAVLTLVLTHGEPGAPFLVWLSLLGAIALRRVAPEGRLGSLGRIWYLVTVAALVIFVVPFARDQVRDALYPQVARAGLEAGYAPGGFAGGMLDDEMAPAATNVPQAPPPPPVETLEAEGRLEEKVAAQRTVAQQVPAAKAPSRGRSSYSYNVALEQDPKAVLQTGPGVPSWTWHTYSLQWTGPVGPDHQMRLFLASPALNRVLTGLRLLLLGLLALVLLTGRWPRLPRRASAPLVAGLAALALLAAPAASAEEPTTPSPQILEELKQRLTRPAPCAPRCVTTPTLQLLLTRRQLAVSADVHVADDGTWAVPGPVGSWAASDVRVDGASGHRNHPPRRRIPSPAALPRGAPGGRVRSSAPRRQLHAPVRRPAETGRCRRPRLGGERAADRRAARGLHPPLPATRGPGNRSPGRGPLRPLAGGHSDARASAWPGRSRPECGG